MKGGGRGLLIAFLVYKFPLTRRNFFNVKHLSLNVDINDCAAITLGIPCHSQNSIESCL